MWSKQNHKPVLWISAVLSGRTQSPSPPCYTLYFNPKSNLVKIKLSYQVSKSPMLGSRGTPEDSSFSPWDRRAYSKDSPNYKNKNNLKENFLKIKRVLQKTLLYTRQQIIQQSIVMARASKDLVKHLTLICDNDLGERVIKKTCGTPSSDDALSFTTLFWAD